MQALDMVLHFLPLAGMAFATGLLTRLVDLEEDDGLRIPWHGGLLMGFAYGLMIGFVVVSWPETSALLGVFIAVALAKKLDGPGHYAGLLGLCAALAWFGLPKISLLPLALFIAAGLADEAADSLQESRRMPRPAASLLSLRPFVELAAFAYSLATGFWEVWIVMLSYDVAFVAFRRLAPRRGKP